MCSALRTLTLLVLALGLAACAGPRYQTAYRYEGPTDAAGRACLEGCTIKMSECSEQCTTKNQACLAGLEPLLDERYNAALMRYDVELDRYRQELVQHDFNMLLGWSYYPYPWRRGLWPYSHWIMPYYFPPTPPIKPSRSAEFERLRHERCEVGCGCQAIYDACFLACGGKKIPLTPCIGDCLP